MSTLTKAHIEKLVAHFYSRAQEDKLLGPIFNEVARVDWEQHIPLLCQFWNSIMLKTSEYHGNAYMKHVLIGKQIAVQEEHFSRWLDLFQQEAIKHLPTDAAKQIVDRSILIAKSLSYGMLEKR
jgi:hemoglobin